MMASCKVCGTVFAKSKGDMEVRQIRERKDKISYPCPNEERHGTLLQSRTQLARLKSIIDVSDEELFADISNKVQLVRRKMHEKLYGDSKRLDKSNAIKGGGAFWYPNKFK